MSDNYVLMAEYNQWMNQRLYEVCSDISDDVRKNDAGLFFKSIHSTLNHILFGDYVWMYRFTNEKYSSKDLQLGKDLFEDFVQLSAERKKMDKRILDWSSQLSTEWLEAPFTFMSQSDGRERTMPAKFLVIHMFNHQTHHRGQVTTILSQQGRDYGVTDIPWMFDQK